MVYFPLKKCYYISKLLGLFILVITVLSLFEKFRGGKKSISAATELEVELERQIVEDEARIIPSLGEGGAPASLEGDGKRLGEESEKQYAINVYLSDRIPYNRTLKDSRNPSCKRVVYDAELPSASVIIIFHNEPYSVVIRTLWSVINSARRENPWFRTANYIDKKTGKGMNLGYKGQDADAQFIYLKEIILVDDNSTLPELKDKLSHYVRTRLPPDLIRILRLPDRVGLTRARLAGARYASGDVLIFLDAHCESQPDWMRPLLQRVKDSPHAVVVPVIDVIESSDFYYSVLDPVVFQVGGFTFSGHFIWIDVPEREKKRRGSDISPTWSPTMAGGLFAIKRSYYWELGAYDEQMSGWGGENLEMSFRIWQCGGTLETIPCSRVGHVFRSFHPYGLPAQSDTHGINTARMAEVWMDDFAELFYLHRPDLRKSDKIGDVTHRKILREKLKCKSFQWYLDNIYREKFVPVRDVDAFGRFMNPLTGLCLDTLQRESEPAPLGVYPCHAALQPTQYLSLSAAAQLRDEERCAHVHTHSRRDGTDVEQDGRSVMMMSCRPHQRGQKWRYIPATQQIQNLETRLCLESPHEAGADVIAKLCSDSRKEQRWHIDYTDNTFDNNNIDQSVGSQEVKLQKLRGQRISRSLMSHADSDSASTRRRKNKKNKFVLKLLRNFNGTEQHLEADIHCKHKTLYPNDTFVRDIVTILNDKDIKVINNGRVFEKNRVYEVARKKKKAVRVKNKHKRAGKRKHHKHVSTESPTTSAARPPPSPAPATPSAPAPAERKIIIEDFIVVTSERTETTTTSRMFIPKAQMKTLKKRHRKRIKADEPLTPAAQRARRVSSEADDRVDDEENEVEEEDEDPGFARRTRDSSEQTDLDEDVDSAADNVLRSRHRHAKTPKRPSSSGERSGETEPPLKLVMRSNLTFNLEDEMLRSKPDDVASLLGELVIPESVRAPKNPPARDEDHPARTEREMRRDRDRDDSDSDSDSDQT